jgi:hypothetical protein
VLRAAGRVGDQLSRPSSRQRCALRSGNVHSADGWRAVLEPVVARYRGTVKRRYFRADAAFANPETYAFLEAERRTIVAPNHRESGECPLKARRAPPPLGDDCQG